MAGRPLRRARLNTGNGSSLTWYGSEGNLHTPFVVVRDAAPKLTVSFAIEGKEHPTIPQYSNIRLFPTVHVQGTVPIEHVRTSEGRLAKSSGRIVPVPDTLHAALESLGLARRSAGHGRPESWEDAANSNSSYSLVDYATISKAQSAAEALLAKFQNRLSAVEIGGVESVSNPSVGRPLHRTRKIGTFVHDWWINGPGRELESSRTSLTRASWSIMGRLTDPAFGTPVERKILEDKQTAILTALDILKDI